MPTFDLKRYPTDFQPKMYPKQVLMVLVLIIGVTAASGKEISAWQDIKNSVTNVLRDLGVPRAGEPCVNVGRELNRCIADINGSLEEVPFLECDQYVGIGGVGMGVCNVKSWIVFFALALVAAIPISILCCICCLCCGCGCR